MWSDKYKEQAEMARKVALKIASNGNREKAEFWFDVSKAYENLYREAIEKGF